MRLLPLGGAVRMLVAVIRQLVLITRVCAAGLRSNPTELSQNRR